MKKIIVAVGMNENSHQVIQFSDKVAQKFGAELTFYHVSPRPVLAAAMVGGIPVPESPQFDYANIREKFVSYIAKQSIQATFFIEHDVGVPQQALADFAEKEQPDLLIMGAHDHSLIERLFIGSTANYVLHHSKVPVYLHRPAQEWDNFMLVPIDIQSVHSEVIKKADLWAKTFQSELVFLYVDSYLPYYQSWAPEIYSDIYSPAFQGSTAVPSEITNKLQKIINEAEVSSPYSVEVVKGKAGPTILEYQKLKKCKSIFLASHSYQNLERFLLGSVTDFLVNHGNCSFYIHK